MGRTLLCVHPHPDDESIACGGVLARAAEAGIRTVVVTCTGGEEGENHSGVDLGDKDMGAFRRRELARALTTLQVADSHLLGYRDSGMMGAAANTHPDSFHLADLEQAAAELAAIIRHERPDVVVSDDANGTYGHPDHIKANRVTVRAVALAADPAAAVAGAPWQVAKRYVHTLGHGRLTSVHRKLLAAGFLSPFGDGAQTFEDGAPFGTPDAQITTEVDVRAWMPTKRAALEDHRSQIGPDSMFLNTPEELTDEFLGMEQFVLEEGALGAPRPEPDLFAGLPDPHIG